jgi:ribosome-binding protein aMBF1 (putative translation factor)
MNQVTRRLVRRGAPIQKILDAITGDDPKLRVAIRKQTRNVVIGEMIYAARVAAGLSQTQLAKLVKTTQSVISRLEDADYEGHTLSMLQRIADALHCRLEVRLVLPKSRKRSLAAIRSSS